MSSAQPLRLELAASRPYAALIFLLHAGAAACFLTVLTGFPAAAAAFLMAALGYWAARDRALLRSPTAPRTLELQSHGKASCVCADRACLALGRPPASGVTRFWVSLPPAAGAGRGLLIAKGMLPPDQFRLLRLWALWGRWPRVASGPPAG